MSGSSQKASSYVKVDFKPDPGFELNFDGLHGEEHLGRPFFYSLAMSAGELRGNVQQLVGSVASIKFVGQDRNVEGEDPDDRFINGIVTRVTSEGLARGSYHYTVELHPWIWLLDRIEDCKIFQNLSAFDIITKVFRDAGFSDFQDRRRNSAGSAVLEYCVQYRESSLAFVTRLMEEYGIYYFWRHAETTHTLVFADDPNSHTELTKAVPFQFDRTEYRGVDDHLWEWSTEYSLQSGKYAVRDYNFETPAADMTAKSIKPGSHQHATFEVYEYPGPYRDTGLGQNLADVRMQAIASDRALFKGISNSRLLHSGWKFKLTEHKDKTLNRDYLIVGTEMSASIGEGMSSQDEEGEKLDTYRVTMHGVAGDVNFRMHRKTPRPMIRGPQTARVVGPSGEEIYTDKYGRIKVKFHWDRADSSDEERTCWIRVAQAWAGAGWGGITIPRVGMEVVVEFLEGNPDRPLVTGLVYNATQTVPYALPGDKTRTSFKTSSSPGNGGFNELRFEDKAGQEEVFFQAQKDYNKKVLHNETVSVKQDTTTTVEQGNRSVTVSQGNDGLTVSTGNHTITVSAGKSDISAMQSITLTCGGTSIKISPTGVEISGPMIKVSGEASITLSAAMIAIN